LDPTGNFGDKSFGADCRLSRVRIWYQILFKYI